VFSRSVIALPLSMLFIASCGGPPKPIDIEKLLQDFIGADLAMSPVTATETGFHDYEGVNLDSILDDYSERGVRGYRVFYNTMHHSVDGLDSTKLGPETRADLALIRSFCEEQLFSLDTLQVYRHNPTMYVELVGRAVNGPLMLGYASKEKRFQQIISRLNRVPQFLDTAKANLIDSPELWNKVAQQENEGNIALIDQQVRSQVPAQLKSQFDSAASTAVAALRAFDGWLDKDLSARRSDWRLGGEKYARKFSYQVSNGKTPEQTLAAAQAKLDQIREHMRDESAQLWPKYFPGRAKPKELNGLVSAVLGRIAQDHTSPDKFFDQAKADLAEATGFVREHHLLALPKLDNLQVIPTPEFMRGIYAVGGFNPAPALQPNLGAYFWITPITPDMPEADIESKLREYNRYGLQTLVIHEAMPGHWVQFQYANEVEPRSRGVLRTLLSSNPYVEGWAVYATQVMIDQGYEASPEMKLTFQKQMLRVVANAILDVKMQTQNMTDDEALELMINQAFQEKQEAVAKVRRAKLTSCQLPTYFAGWQAWLQLRDDYRRKMGSRFDLAEFHAKALTEGGIPMSTLSKLMLQ
jgi:uncharacterized protein (DUF885 family)